MSEAVSALPGAKNEGEVAVEEAGLRGMVTLRGDLDSEAIALALKDATGLPVPAQRQIVGGDGRAVAWMSPDELLIMVPHPEAPGIVGRLSAALSGEHHLALDVSDARAVFSIHGKGAREVLAKGAPVDLSPAGFARGEVRRTRVGQIAAAFWLVDEDHFELVCFRSVAGFMFEWLKTAALPGSLPEYF
ncbi:MAG: sarcosine oxidase subunit gamma [Paracoccaceae bacterium]